MNIVFAGTPAFAATALQTLLQNRYPIAAVYTQPDRAAGRGMKQQQSPVKELALQHAIPVCQPEHFKSPDSLAEMASWQAEFMLVAAYGLILPPAVLQIPKWGCINIHASLLPRWRGAAPIARAIEAGDHYTGVSIMQMNAGLDTGAILLQSKCTIAANETAGSLHDKLATMGAQNIIDFLQRFADNDIQSLPQDNSTACYANKLNKTQALIDWNEPAQLIERKIRAYNPWPVAYTHCHGMRLRLWEATLQGSAPPHTRPGEVANVQAQGVDVVTGAGLLRLKRLQRAGGKAMTANAYLNANRLARGTLLQ